ncbi:MAG TPA: metalloregulator ArsR/SmtB family transcription factor [Hyphomonas sp.]|nr:metalloregulator ArsR/SmtB family transcription factor [Hyphomonas sp.]MCA8904632.1 metalloregulator ArsR/SmtB family transcription factor [Hyphomonas sp.]MCB9960637.1 metalloregulator ArsR/SmtB family transcription factor [Hyphomonas sp.]HPE47219.1 metalloregulator ArsR/SmtB family transcription factor [Hyphomonas sp.]
MTSSFEQTLDHLRAAGEPTRLRILALLRERDLSVGELVQVLSLSQPRLSHHLKALTAAGLVERLPEGAFVFYRAASRGEGGAFLQALFRRLGSEVPEFLRDAERLNEVSEARAASAQAYFSSVAENWDAIRSLHYPNEAIEAALLDMAGPGPFRRVVDFGTGTGRMLALFAPRADDAEGIDLSHHMLTVARANLEQSGVPAARVRQGDVTATPFEDGSADLVIIHQVLHYVQAPNRVIAEAARILVPGGRLLVVDFAPHDLEFLRADHGHHRLGLSDDTMSAWAKAAGLTLAAPRSFGPPTGSSPGLTVNIWSAVKRADSRESAA